MSLPIKLISTDFDGTIFSEFENPAIPRVLQDLIAELQARGAKWVINTGRDMSSLMEALGRAHIMVEPDFLVLVEREIHAHENSSYVGLEEWNSACRSCHGELFEKVLPDVPGIISWINARFHARIYEDPYSPFCLIAANNEEADTIHAYLEEYARRIPNLSVVRNDIYARFSHTAYNKGTALAELTRRLGISASAVLAAGDHLNDLPMLSKKFAQFLAAPANAIPAVKEQINREGGYLSQAHAGLGVAEAIKYYVGDSMS